MRHLYVCRMQRIKVGIIGHGNAAAKHRAAYAELPELFLETNTSEADIIDICTPSGQHFADIKTYWDKPVIVEKPLCGSLAECDDLRERSQPVYPIFQYQFVDPGVGPSLVLHWKRPIDYFSGWRGKAETALGGCLTTHGIHAIHHLLKRYGTCKRVYARMDTLTYDTWVEDTAVVLMEMASGRFCTVNVIIDLDGGTSTWLGDSHAGYVAQFKDIHRAWTWSLPPTVTLQDARNAIEVLAAAYWSHASGFPVRLPFRSEMDREAPLLVSRR